MKFLNPTVGKLVALAIALSFFAMLAPIASASRDSGMPCCAGKAAGHCESGIPAKKVPPPPSEPMCGLDNSAIEDDGITVVAEPTHNESHADAAESTSVNKPCRMECGACTSASSRQQKRERGIAEAKGHQTSPSSSVSRREDLPLVFTSNNDWSRITPRGPPSDLR